MSLLHSELKIGLVGAGGIVKTRHLPALRKIEGVEIVAVCNSTYESSEAFCREFVPTATPYANWAEVVADPDIHIIWIGTPPYLHASVAVSALEAGKHVFCQARMAMNFAEAEEMQAAALRNPHLVTMLCPPPHGMKGGLFFQKLLAEEFVGRPHHLQLKSLSGAYLDLDAPPHWRQRDELSGLNVLTLGIYAEVLQRWFGPIAQVVAHKKTIQPVRQGYELRIPDLVTVLSTFADGLEGVLEFSGVAPFAEADRLTVYGDRGRLDYDFANDEISGGQLGQKQPEKICIPESLEQRWSVEEDFISAVRSPTGIVPHPTFTDGVLYMKVVQAVADSLEQKREIEIV
jgi:predicted dehydrogenase